MLRNKFDDSRESFKNFLTLIHIWKDFYSYRPKDSASLQHSTMIKFNIWLNVTSILLEKDFNKKKVYIINIKFIIKNYFL